MVGAVENIIYLADSYKVSHHRQYPEGTTQVYSYFESRGGKWETVCFFGLQYILKRWLVGPVVTAEMVQEAKEFYKDHFGQDLFNADGWMRIVEVHGGHLPLRIKAVPEGTVLPTRNVLFSVENTDPQLPWLTNFMETLLVQTWYPMTVCTNSRAQKEILAKFLRDTADSMDGLSYQLHDFGFRGASSVESAGIGGAAHLVNFQGSDTIAALQLCKKYYNCPMAGFSVPAAEHSTITTWREEGETAAYKNMMTQFPEGIVSVVSDSYDIFRAVSELWGGELRDQVIARGEKGCLVIRPDSGDPATVVLQVLNLLAEKFPCSKNKKGYKLLPTYLRVLQGDGISFETLSHIISTITEAGWSAANLVFGSGGALLQKVDRDTQRCAYKCSLVTINGEELDVSKNPATDSGKRSKRGRLTLERTEDGGYITVQEGRGDPEKDLLKTVFLNGELLIDYTLEDIRARAELEEVKEAKARAEQTETVGMNNEERTEEEKEKEKEKKKKDADEEKKEEREEEEDKEARTQ